MAIERLRTIEMLEHAARAIGKIDAQGRRGVINCSEAEIEAMALVLAIGNFPQIAPGRRLATEARAALFADMLAEEAA